MKRKKIILALLICVAVSASAMFTFSQIAKAKLRAKAVNEASLEADILKKTMNFSMLSTDWTFGCFLSGFCETQVEPLRDTVKYSFSINRRTLDEIGTDGIFRKMESFLKYYGTYHGLYFIVNPGIMECAPDGLALLKFSNDDTTYNLQDNKNIFETDFYQKVKTSEDLISRVSTVHRDGLTTWTIGTPVFDDEGVFIGECWAEVTAKFLSEILFMFKSSDDIEVSVITEGSFILASSDPEKNGKNVEVVYRELGKQLDKKEKKLTEKWMLKAYELIESDTEGMFISHYLDERSYTFVRKLAIPGSYMVIVKSFDDIVRTVNHFRYQFLTTCTLAMILLCLTLLFIFREFEKEYENITKIESELSVASGIQRSILPGNICTERFEIYGFQRPAKSVGGDLFDYFIKDSKLHFCIGDVSGKGIPAALVMTELCSLYRYIAKRRNDASDIMRTLNTAVMEHSDDSMICTLFVAVLDLCTGEMGFCNAGHNPPAVIRNDGEVSIMEIKANMPLYAFDSYPYASSSIQLNRGDRIFLYTDGVTEARNTDGKFLGTEAMLSRLKADSGRTLEGLVSGMMEGVSDFTKHAVQNDDISILCIEYKG